MLLALISMLAHAEDKTVRDANGKITATKSGGVERDAAGKITATRETQSGTTIVRDASGKIVAREDARQKSSK